MFKIISAPVQVLDSACEYMTNAIGMAMTEQSFDIKLHKITCELEHTAAIKKLAIKHGLTEAALIQLIEADNQ